MKNISLIYIIVLTLCSCENLLENKNIQAALPHGEHVSGHSLENKHWTYEGETGPEHWAEIERQSDCDGKRQSPINIIDYKTEIDPNLKPLDIHYSNSVKIHEVTNNGHSIQYNFEKGDFIYLKDEKYELHQIHFHEASEHTINGIRYPLEMHMVHINRGGKIAVLAVMAEEGKSSAPFTFLERYLPVRSGETKQIDANFDLSLNLPKNREYYTYEGSLTTPPCTQRVSWYVFKTPITISLHQVKQLKELMPLNNYRDEQALNGRTVKHCIPI